MSIIDIYIAYLGQFAQFVNIYILLFILFATFISLPYVWKMHSLKDVIWKYHFDTDQYDEHSDPSDLRNYYIDIFPKYPFPSSCIDDNNFKAHSYRHILPPNLSWKDHFHDFPVSVLFTYKYDSLTGRQHIYFSKNHTFLALYNHSDFLKMHLHWPLGMSELIIDLPDKFFKTPGHLFLFCETFPF